METLGRTMLEQMAPIALELDQANNTDLYSQSHRVQADKIEQSDLTPSATILAAMEEQDLPFFSLAMNYSRQWAESFRANPLSGSWAVARRSRVHWCHKMYRPGASIASRARCAATSTFDSLTREIRTGWCSTTTAWSNRFAIALPT